jgi:hypothetical protein
VTTTNAATGRVAYQASGVSIENLTVCNFLAGGGENGNEIWWDGGDGSGLIGMGAFRGAYLNATSTFQQRARAGALEPELCQQLQRRGLLRGRLPAGMQPDDAQDMGTVQRPRLLGNQLRRQADRARIGVRPQPRRLRHQQPEQRRRPLAQDGSCPNGGRSPVTHSASCWVFMDNYVHDNNNPNVPGAGVAGSSPVGTGVSISGGRFDTLLDNRIVHNGAWGVLLVPFPATETPPPVAHCQGGTETGSLGFGCLYDDWGNQVFGNKFSKNGFFGNPTNGDIGQITFFGGNPVNCLKSNKLPDGFSPESLLTNTCGTIGSGEINQPLLEQAECDTQILSTKPCPPGSEYPRRTTVKMHALPAPSKLRTMPDPCAGVPANPWCPPGKPRSR